MELKCLVIDLYSDNSITRGVVNSLFFQSAYNVQVEYCSSQSDKKCSFEEQYVVLFVTSMYLVLNPSTSNYVDKFVERYMKELIERYKYIKYKSHFVIFVEFTFRLTVRANL